MIKYITLLIFGFLCVVSLNAQNIPFDKQEFPEQAKELKSAVKDLKEGNYSFEERQYNESLPFFLKAQSFNPNNADLNRKIGVCYLNTLYKTKSLGYLEKSYLLDTESSPMIYYYLGWSHHLNENWDEAISFYSKQKKTYEVSKKSVKDNQNNIKALEKKIQECKYGKEFVLHPVDVKLENLGENINTQFPEYLVIINADESVMMFTSQRPGSTGETQHEATDQYVFHHEDIYSTDLSDSTWQQAVNIGPPVNTEINDATIALAPDGHTVLTYNDSDGSGDIYECNLEGDKWSQPKKLSSTINSDYHESSASFSYDGKSLYFVSNNPENNFGDHDIYVSHWDEGIRDWGVAENLGEKINTPFSEQGVFAHPDGKSLYFSSKGHNTMGGFDIFKTVWDDETNSWSEPVNMGYPINGPDNDVGLVLSASGLHGYVSAYHKDSYGKEDIYLITFPQSEQEHLTILKGHVVDCETKKAIYADIEIIDLEEHKSVSHFESNSETGHYLVSLPAGINYAIKIDDDHHLFYSENIDLPETDTYHEITRDICLNQIEVGKKMVLKNVFFDSDEASLRPTSVDELNLVFEFMQLNPNLKIEFSGHTDDIGSDDYNQNLSERRAHAVVDYLIEKGIDPARLTYVGYGEMQPVITNKTVQGRQMNRRTEMKIVGK
jgi:outer membrane protein OmpA-like peptidoglycan-associated protein